MAGRPETGERTQIKRILIILSKSCEIVDYSVSILSGRDSAVDSAFGPIWVYSRFAPECLVGKFWISLKLNGGSKVNYPMMRHKQSIRPGSRRSEVCGNFGVCL